MSSRGAVSRLLPSCFPDGKPTPLWTMVENISARQGERANVCTSRPSHTHTHRPPPRPPSSPYPETQNTVCMTSNPNPNPTPVSARSFRLPVFCTNGRSGGGSFRWGLSRTLSDRCSRSLGWQYRSGFTCAASRRRWVGGGRE